MLRDFHSLGNKSSLWNDWMAFHNPIAWCDTTHSFCCILGLMQNSCQHCTQAWDMWAKLGGDCTEHYLKCAQELSQSDDSSAKKCNDGFLKKSKWLPDYQLLEGRNLFFRDASLMKVCNKKHNRAEIQPQPWGISEITEQAFIAPTRRKHTVVSFSNCHHQWLKWPTWNQGEFGHSSIVESKLRHWHLLKQLNHFPVYWIPDIKENILFHCNWLRMTSSKAHLLGERPSLSILKSATQCLEVIFWSCHVSF